MAGRLRLWGRRDGHRPLVDANDLEVGQVDLSAKYQGLRDQYEAMVLAQVQKFRYCVSHILPHDEEDNKEENGTRRPDPFYKFCQLLEDEKIERIITNGKSRVAAYLKGSGGNQSNGASHLLEENRENPGGMSEETILNKAYSLLNKKFREDMHRLRARLNEAEPRQGLSAIASIKDIAQNLGINNAAQHFLNWDRRNLTVNEDGRFTFFNRGRNILDDHLNTIMSVLNAWENAGRGIGGISPYHQTWLDAARNNITAARDMFKYQATIFMRLVVLDGFQEYLPTSASEFTANTGVMEISEFVEENLCGTDQRNRGHTNIIVRSLNDINNYQEIWLKQQKVQRIITGFFMLMGAGVGLGVSWDIGTTRESSPDIGNIILVSIIFMALFALCCHGQQSCSPSGRMARRFLAQSVDEARQSTNQALEAIYNSVKELLGPVDPAAAVPQPPQPGSTGP